MKNFYFFPVVFIFFLSFQTAFAKPVSKSAAFDVARNFIVRTGQYVDLKSGSLSGLMCEEYGKLRDANGLETESPALYIINLEPKGFVIVSGDDGISPVLAYSRENNFDTEHMHPVLVALLDSYEGSVNYRIMNNLPPSAEVKMEWTTYLNEAGALKSSSPIVLVGPLTTTKWGYLWPHNRYCPADSAASAKVGHHCPPGCGPIAMAQLMKYWNWPDSGKNCNPLYGWQYGYLWADFGRTRYDWENMPDVLDTNSTEAQIHAVAHLIYHCGIGADVTYSPKVSYTTFAIDTSVPNKNCLQLAFSKYFRYKKTIKMDPISYQDTSWNSIIRKEIIAKRPVICEAWSGNDGHNFIFDGFDSDGRLCINWGWSGGDNGCYWIDTLKIPSVGFYFTSKLKILTGIEPDTAALNNICKADNLALNESVRIYPNPASDKLHVNMDCTMDGFKDIEILNSQGVRILNVPYSCQPLQIPLERMTSGVYFLRLNNHKNSVTKKFIIQK